jgi:hypothetical protein
LFGFVAVVLGNPEPQTVSHSFPKVSAALQREFGTDAAYRADGRYVFGLVIRGESHYQWHRLGFCSGDATPLAEMGEVACLFVVTHRTCTMPGAMRRLSAARS